MLTDPARVRLSVIVPVHDVEEYLPAFLTSLEGREDARPDEIVFVDDGSQDGSADLIAGWVASRPEARLIRTENRGVSAARNIGLDAVTGDWVCFLDPDDVLGQDYFRHLSAFVAAHADLDLVATALHRIQEPETRFRDNHPLRFRFAGGSRVSDLADDVFVMNVASVAFPTAALRGSGVRFRTGLHASEDALFVAEHLLSLGRAPRAGFVADAHYGYRKRAARTSAVDRYRSDPSTYIVRFRDGYAPLLQQAAGAGTVPSWLQSMVLYEMQWLLPVQMDPDRHAGFLDAAERAATVEALRSCLRHITDDRLLRYDATALPLESRLLILALTDRPLWDWVGAYASMPRGWRRTADVISYRVGTQTGAGDHRVAWYPDYFGQHALVAVRSRVPDSSTVVRVGDADDVIVRPRPGETLAQTQDRHRRAVLGESSPFIPALEHEVYVRRTRAWADTAADRRVIRREQRRRGLWSKDAWIGRIFRPGHGILVEHPATDDERSRRLISSLRTVARAREAGPAGTARRGRAMKHGSLGHRIARARSGVLVSVRPSGRPSPRARLRALRALVVSGGLTPRDALEIRRFSPELIITPDQDDLARLHSIGLGASDVLVIPDSHPDTVAAAISGRSVLDDSFSRRKVARIGS